MSFLNSPNYSGSSGTGSAPKGLTVQNGDTVLIATINSIQITQKGKKLVQQSTKFTPSAIAANPAVSGEFAVGADVINRLLFFINVRIRKFIFMHTLAPPYR